MLTYGYCHRYAPTQGPLCWVRPQAEADATCGEWADKTIAPEQEAKRELVRRFAVALFAQPHAADTEYEVIWESAERMAGFEPKFDSGKPSA